MKPQNDCNRQNDFIVNDYLQKDFRQNDCRQNDCSQMRVDKLIPGKMTVDDYKRTLIKMS